MAGRFGEEDLGRGLQPKGKVAIVGLIQIEREQLVFGVEALQLPGQPGFAQLAPERFLVAFLHRQEQVARQLLRERAAAADHGAPAQVLPGGAGDGDGIHAGMQIEAAVLGGERGLDTGRGDAVQRQVKLFAGIRVKRLVERAAVAVDEARRGPHQPVNRGGRGREIGEQPEVEGEAGECTRGRAPPDQAARQPCSQPSRNSLCHMST